MENVSKAVENLCLDHDIPEDFTTKLRNCVAREVEAVAMENEIQKRQLREVTEKLNSLEKESMGKINIQRSNSICAGGSSVPTLTSTQKKALEMELKCLEDLAQFGIRDLEDEDDLTVLIGELCFDKLAENVQMHCPLVTDIVKCLTSTPRLGRNTGKKDEMFKFKSGLQLIQALQTIRSQKVNSDFSTMFGLLLVSYGAGKTMLDMLEPFGLCKSYNY